MTTPYIEPIDPDNPLPLFEMTKRVYMFLHNFYNVHDEDMPWDVEGVLFNFDTIKRLYEELHQCLESEIPQDNTWTGYFESYRSKYSATNFQDALTAFLYDLEYFSDRWGWGRLLTIEYVYGRLLEFYEELK